MHTTTIFVLSCLVSAGFSQREIPDLASCTWIVGPHSDVMALVMDREEDFEHCLPEGAELGVDMHQLEPCKGPAPEESLATFLLAATPGVARSKVSARAGMRSPQMSTGLYYSTSTGNTETVAEYIANAAGVEDWKDIGDASDEEIMGHDSIIVGSPTWHTGADSERSGTTWDEWLYKNLPAMDFTGKKVAIFGVGDSNAYGDNYCEAVGELYDCFSARGANVFGMLPSSKGFDYTASKSVRGDKFVGAVFDEDNYGDESEDRANAWVEQLKSEGFM